MPGLQAFCATPFCKRVDSLVHGRAYWRHVAQLKLRIAAKFPFKMVDGFQKALDLGILDH
jgi:hypothetical protein